MNYFFIYNVKQANFFLHKGLLPVNIGLGARNEVFLKFVRNPESEEIFYEWVNRNK